MVKTSTSKGILELKLLDKKYNVIESIKKEITGRENVIETFIENVKPWSPENPNLYLLLVNLWDNNRVVDSVEEWIGFRSFEIKNGSLHLNGKEIFLKGFGRHEDFPVTGKHVPGAVLVRDFYLMKYVNANSFRTSHYPYSDENLDLADRLGFLVILETPLCLSGISGLLGGAEKAREWCSNPILFEKMLRIIEELIKQHRNRPSVIMYSVANEPPTRLEEYANLIKKLIEAVKKIDSTRPVTFASYNTLQVKAFKYVAVISLNLYYGWYSDYGDIEKGLEKALKEVEKLHLKYPDKPIILTEFGAGAIAGLHSTPPLMWSEEYQAEFLKKYIEKFSKLNYISGLHVWNLTDFRTPESPKRTIYNRKGIFTRDRRPKLAVHIMKELFEKVS